MISINVIDKYPRTEKVCNFCLERIEKKESRIRTTERKSRKPDKLKVSHYHILCAAKSKNAQLESAVLKYAYDLRLKRDAMTKLIKAVEDEEGQLFYEQWEENILCYGQRKEKFTNTTCI